jgi:hypothetical protein
LRAGFHEIQGPILMGFNWRLDETSVLRRERLVAP